MSDIYLNIKNIATRKRITQKDLAQALNVTPNTVGNWINKKIGLRAEQVPEIAKVLRVPISRLYNSSDNDTEDMPASEEEINFKVDFMMKQLEKKEERLEQLIRENDRLVQENKKLRNSKTPYGIVAEK